MPLIDLTTSESKQCPISALISQLSSAFSNNAAKSEEDKIEHDKDQDQFELQNSEVAEKYIEIRIDRFIDLDWLRYFASLSYVLVPDLDSFFEIIKIPTSSSVFVCDLLRQHQLLSRFFFDQKIELIRHCVRQSEFAKDITSIFFENELNSQFPIGFNEWSNNKQFTWLTKTLNVEQNSIEQNFPHSARLRNYQYTNHFNQNNCNAVTIENFSWHQIKEEYIAFSNEKCCAEISSCGSKQSFNTWQNFFLMIVSKLIFCLGLQKAKFILTKDLLRITDKKIFCACKTSFEALISCNNLEEVVFLPQILWRFRIDWLRYSELFGKNPLKNDRVEFAADDLIQGKKCEKFSNIFDSQIYIRKSNVSSLFPFGFCADAWKKKTEKSLSLRLMWQLSTKPSSFGPCYNKAPMQFPSRTWFDTMLNKLLRIAIEKGGESAIKPGSVQDLMSAAVDKFPGYELHWKRGWKTIENNLRAVARILKKQFVASQRFEKEMYDCIIEDYIGPICVDHMKKKYIAAVTTQMLPSDEDVLQHSIAGVKCLESVFAHEALEENVYVEIYKISGRLESRIYSSAMDAGSSAIGLFLQYSTL